MRWLMIPAVSGLSCDQLQSKTFLKCKSIVLTYFVINIFLEIDSAYIFLHVCATVILFAALLIFLQLQLVYLFVKRIFFKVKLSMVFFFCNGECTYWCLPAKMMWIIVMLGAHSTSSFDQFTWQNELNWMVRCESIATGTTSLQYYSHFALPSWNFNNRFKLTLIAWRTKEVQFTVTWH